MSNIESVKALIKFGADPLLKSVTGHRPIDLATNVEIFDLLVEYEKNVSIRCTVYLQSYDSSVLKFGDSKRRNSNRNLNKTAFLVLIYLNIDFLSQHIHILNRLTTILGIKHVTIFTFSSL